MYFGKYLKELRLSKGYGMSRFARLMGILPSELSNIERGRIQPPQDNNFINTIITKLSLLNNEQLPLKNFWKKNNIVKSKKREIGVPLFPITTDGRILSTKELISLKDHINKYYE